MKTFVLLVEVRISLRRSFENSPHIVLQKLFYENTIQ